MTIVSITHSLTFSEAEAEEMHLIAGKMTYGAGNTPAAFAYVLDAHKCEVLTKVIWKTEIHDDIGIRIGTNLGT